MFAHAGLVKKRRLKRRLKAAAAIVVAVAAGTFLACQRVVAQHTAVDADEPTPPGAGPGGPSTASAPSPEITVRSADGSVLADARTDALARRQDRPADAAVDVREHRKGMPVPDNLIE